MRQIVLTLALLLLSFLSLEIEASAVEVELDLGLFNRFTLRHHELERLLRYSPSAGAFDVSSYQEPVGGRVTYSFLATAGIDLQLRKWISFGLTVDSGELAPVMPLAAESTLRLSRLPSSLFGDPPIYTTDDQRTVTSNGRRIGEEARSTAFVRQAYVQLAAPETEWFTATVGRFSGEVARSLVYNDHGLGGRILMDLERLRDWPVRVGAMAVLPTRAWNEGLRSPLVELRVDYVLSALLSLVESIGITASYFHDGDSNFASLFQPSISEAAVVFQPSLDPALHRDVFAVALSTGMPTRADLGWIGVQGNKLFGDLQVSGAVLLEAGRIVLDNPFAGLPVSGSGLSLRIPTTPQIKLDTLGVAIDLSARYLVTPSLAIGGFFLFLSGEDNPVLSPSGVGRYSSFIGVVPYLTHTNLFFSGGLNETFTGRQASTSGLGGRGVIAGGLTASFETLRDKLRLGTTQALLGAPVASHTEGKLYGYEADFEARYTLTDYLRISVEYDLLATGSFFSSRSVIHKLLVGVDLTYER